MSTVKKNTAEKEDTVGQRWGYFRYYALSLIMNIILVFWTKKRSIVTPKVLSSFLPSFLTSCTIAVRIDKADLVGRLGLLLFFSSWKSLILVNILASFLKR